VLAAPARRVLFLDRDGIINERPAQHQYVTRWEDFRFVDGVAPVLRDATQLGYGLIVVTNQQAVGKGLMTAEALMGIHTAMVSELTARGVTIDGVFCCPHLESEQCSCRKPKTGLFQRALNETNYLVDIPGSCFLGDSETDVLAGSAAGLQTILLAPAGAPQPAITPTYLVSTYADVVSILAAQSEPVA
jgi:histidinol-phosphate phosphatase family protein